MTAEPERGVSTNRIERADRRELPIGDAKSPVGQAELGAFALRESAELLAKNLHALEATRIIGGGPPVARSRAQVVLIRFSRLDHGMIASLEPIRAAATL